MKKTHIHTVHMCMVIITHTYVIHARVHVLKAEYNPSSADLFS